MTKIRLQITLDADVSQLLDRVGGSRSEYLCRAVRDRWHEWTYALELLRSGGWRQGEVMAACEILNGSWRVGPSRSNAEVAIALQEVPKTDAELTRKWRLDARRWRKLVKAVNGLEEISSAVCDVAREVWSDNEACRAAIERLPE